MHFPTAGIDVNPFIPPLTALVVSTFTSMGGVSGAFLLLPFQMSVLGYTAPGVSATNQLFNIVAIPSGVYRYVREGRMVWPLSAIVLAGTLPGVFFGALIRVSWLPDPDTFKPFAGLVLAYIGARLVADLLGKRKPGSSAAQARAEFAMQKVRHQCRAQKAKAQGQKLPATRVLSLGWRTVSYEFLGLTYAFSTPGVLGLSIIVGLVGGIYGIGGGAIMAPFLVTVFGLPVYTVAGATLLATFATSVFGVAFYALLAPLHPQQAIAPDVGLGVLFGLGGMAGMYLGARLQKRVPARIIKSMLAAVVCFTAAKYLLAVF